MAAAGDDPKLMDLAIQKLNILNAADDKARKDAGQAADSEWTPKIMKDPTSVNSIDDLTNDPLAVKGQSRTG